MCAGQCICAEWNLPGIYFQRGECYLQDKPKYPSGNKLQFCKLIVRGEVKGSVKIGFIMNYRHEVRFDKFLLTVTPFEKDSLKLCVLTSYLSDSDCIS